MATLQEAASMLKKIGLPGEESYDLPTSKRRFPDGGWYRLEVSGVERLEVLETVVKERNKRNVPIHRLISTVMGATLLDRAELKDFAQLAADSEMEVILTPGPRGTWDTGREVATPEGKTHGKRHRGVSQLKHVITDIMRAIEIGFRGFLVYDEGLMWALNKMRENGDIPEDVVFKVSISTGHGSPASGKMLQELGANSFNPVADLDLPKISSLRQSIDIPIDIHVYLVESAGGEIRFYETPEFARIASPCYFKLEPGEAFSKGPGGLYKPWTDISLLNHLAKEKVKYAQTIHNIVQKNFPEAELSNHGAEDLAIPVV